MLMNIHGSYFGQELDVKMADYKGWLKTRVKLRNGLETMGLGEKWLQGKPELTILEQRVLNRIVQRKIQNIEQVRQQGCDKSTQPNCNLYRNCLFLLPQKTRIVFLGILVFAFNFTCMHA